jgi:hypothetical protein
MPARLRWVLFALVLGASVLRYLAEEQVILDDAFIYVDLARNWLEGIGPRFRAGDQHLPATGALWLVVLTATKLVLPGATWEAVCSGLCLAALAGASTLLHLLLCRRHALAAVMAPIAVFWPPSVPSLCGHDTALATCVGLGLLLARSARRWNAVPVLAALFYLARGEGAVFGAAVTASAAVADGTSRAAILGQVRRMVPGLIAAALLVAAWHGYLLMEFGKVLPSTLSAKVQQAKAGWPTVGAQLPQWFVSSLGNAWLAAAGAIPLLLHCRGLVAWAVIHCGFMALAGVAAYHWYFYPLELTLAVAVLLGIDLIAGSALLLPWPRVAAGLGRVLAAAGLAVGWLLYADHKVGLPEERQQTYQAAAQWMLAQAEALPTRGQRRPRLLTDEVGLLSYYLPGFDIHDVVGLVDPVDDPKRMYDVVFHLRERQPDFVFLGGEPDRAESVKLGEDGWEILRIAYRPAPGYVGRFVHTWPTVVPPEGSLDRRVFELAALTRHPILKSGDLYPVNVPSIGNCLFAHPPAKLVYEWPAGGRRVALGFGMLDACWKGDASTDGVGFAVDAVSEAGVETRLFARELRPKTVEADRAPVVETIAIPAGTRRLHLSTEILGDSRWDFGYWGLVWPLAE